MAKDFTVTLTEPQWHLVQQCVDCAVKAGGLAGAVAIVPVWREIEDQIKPQMTGTPKTATPNES